MALSDTIQNIINYLHPFPIEYEDVEIEDFFDFEEYLNELERKNSEHTDQNETID